MKVLVTGMDGFIGAAISLRLRKVGWEVVGFSVGPQAGKKPDLYCCSVTDIHSVREIMTRERPEVCIHLAGLAHSDVGPGDMQEVRQTNVDGTLNVARAAVEAGVEKFVFFSSAKVYGEATSPEGLDEDETPNPAGIYAVLKWEAEQALLEMSKMGDIGVVCVRPVAVFGPGDSRGNYTRLIRAVRRGFFPVVGGGRALRSVAYLERVAERVVQIINSGFHSGQTYVLSDGIFEVREILEAIRRVTGFAVFPAIPARAALAGGSLIDGLWKFATGREGPAKRALSRLTENFVVKAHRYDSDFGALPPFDLNRAMEETCGPRIGASTSQV